MTRKCLLLIVTMILLSSCAKGESVKNINYYSNLKTSEEQEEVKKILVANDLSNVDTFISWVNDYNTAMNEKGGLATTWSPLEKLNYDEGTLSNRWDESYHGEVDSNGRLVAYLLMKDKIKAEKKQEYSSYIMFDVEALENNERYLPMKNQVAQYQAIFDEVKVDNLKSKDEFTEAYPLAWEERKVTFPEVNVSLISVVMHDSFEKVAFIAHAGVLIQEESSILFIEKVAPGMPYQVTRFENRSGLLKMLKARAEYTAEEEAYPAVILENDKVLME